MTHRTRRRATTPEGQGAAEAFLAALDHPRKAEIEALRGVTLGADSSIREGVAWNSLSFLTGDHFATFNLRPVDTVRVVFYTGAKRRAVPPKMAVDDPAALLKWVAPDRAVATFRDLNEVEANRSRLESIVRHWTGQL